MTLRDVERESGIDYGTVWRLLNANNNKQVFKSGRGRKGKVIMNLTASTLDKLCRFLRKQPGDLLRYRAP